MSWVAVGVGVGSAGLSLFRGMKQKKMGRQQMAAIEGKEVPAALMENQRIASQMAAEGMPAEQYAAAKREIDRANVGAITASNSRRGGLSIIPNILRATNDAYLRLGSNDAQMRNQNQRTLMGVNSQIGGYQNQKYQADYNYGQSLIGAGNENIYGAADSLLAGVGGGLSDMLRTQKMMRGMNGSGATVDGNYQPSTVRGIVPYESANTSSFRGYRGAI